MNLSVNLQTPLDTERVETLRIGDRVLLSGTVYTARDAAHQRLVAALEQGRPLPVELEGQVIYYVGPTPAKPGQPIGAAGPTTSYRMDFYAPALMARGLKGMIGKGARAPAVKEAMQRHKVVYLAAIGGAGALMGKTVSSAATVAYPELGTEAIRKLVVRDMPLIVAGDVHGGDLYAQGVQACKNGGTRA